MLYVRNVLWWPKGFPQEGHVGEGCRRAKSSINGKWCGLTLRGKKDQCKSKGWTSKAKGRIHQASQGKGGHSQECGQIP